MRSFSSLAAFVALSIAAMARTEPQQRAQIVAPDGSVVAVSNTLLQSYNAPRLVKFTGQLPAGVVSPAIETSGGTRLVTFALYAQQEGGEPLWSETQVLNIDAGGRYTAMLGATALDGVPLEVFNSGEARWLSVTIEGSAQQPRMLLVTVPYAIRAEEADQLGGHAASDFVTKSDLQTAVQQSLAQSRTTTTVVSGAQPGGAQPNGGTASPGVGLDDSAHGSNAIQNGAPSITQQGVTGGGAASFSDTSGNEVVFVNQSGTGMAVNAATTGTIAVNGVASANTGIGVRGSATSASGTGVGVRGDTSAPNGQGVVGNATSAGLSDTGVGVQGQSSAGTGMGVNGIASGANGIGVLGTASSPNGHTIGIQGVALSPNGIAGVFNVVEQGATLLSGRLNGTPVFTVDSAGDIEANGVVSAASFQLNGQTIIDRNGNWIGSPTGLIGPQGLQGAQGPAGPTGAQGPTGPSGAAGPQGPIGLTGSIGPMGPVGPVGPAGAQGSAGPSGPQGSTGPQGTQGPQGPVGPVGPIGQAGVGFNFTGPWSLKSNYNANDVVTLGGSTYVATVMNQAQEPDQNPASWTVMAQEGAAGPQGPIGNTGAQGPAGPQGPIGNTGPQGPQGQIGNTGAQGQPGPQGQTGATGAQGQPGPQGPIGNTGPQGPQGQTGATGAQGQPGPQGQTGATGAQGPPGAQGPIGQVGPIGPAGVGFNFTGPWSLKSNYSVNDVVTFSGSTYVATAMNQDQEPDQSPASWSLMAQQGSAGPAGEQGPIGNTGAQGPAGPQGATGDTGAQGPQGQTGATGAQGSPGPQGPTGNTGAQGPSGPQGQTGATGAQGPPGQSGSQGPAGATGPIGPVGPQGQQGPAGASPLSLNGNDVVFNQANSGPEVFHLSGSASPQNTLFISSTTPGAAQPSEQTLNVPAAVFGDAQNAAGFTAGVIGRSQSANGGGAGVIGLVTGAPTDSHATGVAGIANATTGRQIGVSGDIYTSDTTSSSAARFTNFGSNSGLVIEGRGPGSNCGNPPCAQTVFTVDASGNANASGTVTAAHFSGDGSHLTGITANIGNASTLGGVPPQGFAQLAANTNTFSGTISAPLFNGTFNGSGAGLVGVPDTALSANIPRLNAAANNFSGNVSAASVTLASDSSASFSSAPRMVWTTFMPDELKTAYVANQIVFDANIVVTRVTARVQTPSHGFCTTNLDIRVSAASTISDLMLVSGQSFGDSGAITVPVAAGQNLQVSLQSAAQCDEAPINANVNVEYRMQ